jgi:hypothetical protein
VIAALVFVHVVPVADVVDGGPAGRAGAAERDLVVFSAVLRGGTQELAVDELGVVAGLAIGPREKLTIEGLFEAAVPGPDRVH